MSSRSGPTGQRPINPRTGRPYYYKDNPETKILTARKHNSRTNGISKIVRDEDVSRADATRIYDARQQLTPSPIASAMAGPVNVTRDRIVATTPRKPAVHPVLRLARQMARGRYEFLDDELQARLCDDAADLLEMPKPTNKEGSVYAITNPAWPGLFKVGLGRDVPDRLGNYQTGSPYRDYAAEYSYDFGKAAPEAERAVQADLKAQGFLVDNGIPGVDGEWFDCTLTDIVMAIQRYDISIQPKLICHDG